MADSILTKTTSLPSEEVITRAVQFFSTAKWQATTQSARSVTFAGRPPIPWFMILLTLIGYACCIVPGIILYVAVVKKMRRFQNLVVTALPTSQGTEVSVNFPSHANKQAERFLTALPEGK